MADINLLTYDIQNMLSTPMGRELSEEVSKEIAVNVGHRMQRALTRVDRARKPGVLFPSELGHPCDRKTYYEFNYDPATMYPPEEISAQQKFKFTYGDIIESLVIPLAKASGHDVTLVDHTTDWEVHPTSKGGQGWRVRGRIDMVVDGHVVDVKSMAARSFDRWATDGVKADGFGYSAQVTSYQYALGNTAQGYILAIDKEGGKMKLVPTKYEPVQLMAAAKAGANATTARLAAVPDGKSGNMKLCMTCSYCKWKAECWRDSNGGAGLRKFIYSFGPIWLTDVFRVLKVTETPF